MEREICIDVAICDCGPGTTSGAAEQGGAHQRRVTRHLVAGDSGWMKRRSEGRVRPSRISMQKLVLLSFHLFSSLIVQAVARSDGRLDDAKRGNVNDAHVVSRFRSPGGFKCTSGLSCERRCLQNCLVSSLDVQCSRYVCKEDCNAETCEHSRCMSDRVVTCKGDCLPSCRRQVVQELHVESAAWAHCALGHKVKCEMRTCSHLRRADDRESCRARCVARAATACALPERKAKKCLAACGAHLCLNGTCACPVIAGSHPKCAVTLHDINARLHRPEEAHCFQTFWPHMSKSDSLRHQQAPPLLALAPVLKREDENGESAGERYEIVNASTYDLQRQPQQLQPLKVHELSQPQWVTSRDATPMELPLLAARRIHDVLHWLLSGLEAAWEVKRIDDGRHFLASPAQKGSPSRKSLIMRMVMRTLPDGEVHQSSDGRRALSEVIPISSLIDAQLANKIPLKPTNVVPESDLRSMGHWDTCAVVGSSAALAGAGYGPEIDRHTAVIRFNKAPIEGYELDVGNRTTLRLQNNRHCGWCERADELLLPATDYRLGRCYQYEGRPECRLLVLDQSLKEFVSQRDPDSVFQRFSASTLPPPPPQGSQINDTVNSASRRNLREAHRNTHGTRNHLRDGNFEANTTPGVRTRPLGKTLSAGFFGIQLALHLCGEVTVYGFAEDQAHHYYESYIPAMRAAPTNGLVKIYTGRDAHNWALERLCLNVYDRRLPRFRIVGRDSSTASPTLQQ